MPPCFKVFTSPPSFPSFSSPLPSFSLFSLGSEGFNTGDVPVELPPLPQRPMRQKRDGVLGATAETGGACEGQMTVLGAVLSSLSSTFSA